MNKVFLVLVVGGLLLAACGGQSGTAGPQEVKITLTDFGIQSSVTEFKVGVPYHFVVSNTGAIPHEVMLMPPMMADQMGMAMDMEELDKMALAHIGEDQLPAGATASFDYTFTESAPAGTLEFACHIPGHYEAGMKLEITVKE
ncbi:MAG: hypothetical protein Kow0070_06990 [Anaerolineales bacterium]